MQYLEMTVRFVVVVTQGTRPNVIYARAETRENAELMKEAALERGYRNAAIWDYKKFCQAKDERSYRS